MEKTVALQKEYHSINTSKMRNFVSVLLFGSAIIQGTEISIHYIVFNPS